MTGYEIKKRVGTALKSVTNASYGTLYPTLHRLLEEGAVRMEEHLQNHRPARKVYEITEQGQQELVAWLQHPPEADHIRREFLLKLYMASHIPADRLKQLLLHRRENTLAEIADLRQTRETLNGRTPQNQLWVNDYIVAMCKAELNWLNHVIAQLEDEHVPVSRQGSGHPNSTQR